MCIEMAIVSESIVHVFIVSLFHCFMVLLCYFLELSPTYYLDWPCGCHIEAAHVKQLFTLLECSNMQYYFYKEVAARR